MKDLSNQVAFITGGARGIGRGIAEALLQAGAAVFICGRDAATVEAALPELRKIGRVDGAACDVRDETAVNQAFAACVSKFGGVDILIVTI